MNGKLRKFERYLNKINSLAETMKDKPDKELQALTGVFKARLQKGETLEGILPEAFAAIREAADRVLHMYPYDVQVLGGLALHFGNIAEMSTGEGKTLVAVMPLYLNALTGKSTILVTVNNYLAVRDGTQMGELFAFMGLTTGIGVREDAAERITNEEKKEIYAADIVYSTQAALGFDYLSENLLTDEREKYLRPYYYVIVDEADAVLLDSAQTPLVISGAPRVQSNLYNMADFFVSTLREDIEYEFEEAEKKVYLTEKGIEAAERYFAVDNLYKKEHFELARHINLALRAHILFTKGKEYVVEDGQVKLMDEKTGRIIENTKLRSGQHQALEAKEHIDPTMESRAMAAITFQAFFNLFPKISGMTGTAAGDVAEFQDIYHMNVIRIPTRKKIQRKDLPDHVYYDRESQIVEALTKVQDLHRNGQPVLLITSTIDISDACSKILLECGIPHNVLNAYNVAKEAEIIKEAGQQGAVTVATAVAGRGTDIKLGKGVNELGGLAVLGVGLMDNKRLERQARGRSGRQGDPGFSRFYICLEDDVVRGNTPEKILEKYADKTGSVKSKSIRKLVRKAQKNNEDQGRDARRNTMKFAESMQIQRELIYQTRDKIMEKNSGDIDYYMEIQESLIEAFLETQKEIPDRAEIIRYLLDHITYDLTEWPSEEEICNRIKTKTYLMEQARLRIEEQKRKLGTEATAKNFFRTMTLKAIDNCWIEQVDYMQQLRGVLGGRSFTRRDMILEYHKEAHDAFMRMEERIRQDMMKNIMLGDIIRNENGELVTVMP